MIIAFLHSNKTGNVPSLMMTSISVFKFRTKLGTASIRILKKSDIFMLLKRTPRAGPNVLQNGKYLFKDNWPSIGGQLPLNISVQELTFSNQIDAGKNL